MVKFLVTGATGQLGTLVVEALLKLVPADRIAVSVRDPKKAEHLAAQGIDVRQADFNDYESLTSAFNGIDRLLMISTDDFANRVQQHKSAIKAAQETKVRFIAYTSVVNAAESKFALVHDHLETEKAIQASGIPYSILRNNWYLENEMGTFHSVLNGAPWFIASGEGRIGWATRRDYAEAAARVLAGEGHENTIYELSGKPLTQEELSAIFAEALNREVHTQHVDDQAYGQILSQAGLPDAIIPTFVAIQQGIRAGGLDFEGSDFEKVLGRPTTPLGEAIRQIFA